MKRQIVLKDRALNDLNFWAMNNAKVLKRIFALLTTIQNSLFSSLGKPEALKENLQGYWSRRIDEEHRIVYKFEQDAIVIAYCRHHYQDR